MSPCTSAFAAALCCLLQAVWDELLFTACTARYVKVNMLRNSANEGVHLVEVQVFDAKP